VVVDRGDLMLLVATTSLAERGVAEALCFPGRALHLWVHQLLCLSLQQHGVRSSDAYRLLGAAWCFRNVSESDHAAVVQHMVEQEFLAEIDGLLVLAERGEKEFLAANWRKLYAVFEDAPLFDVYEGKNQVGTLDVGFVTQPLEQGFTFVLGGISWQAERIDLEGRRVLARRATLGSAPRWQSYGGSDVPRETAEELGRLLYVDRRVPPWLDDAAKAALQTERDQCDAGAWRPGLWHLDVSEGLTLTTYAGDKVNRTLSLFLKQAIGLPTSGDFVGLRSSTRVVAPSAFVDALTSWRRMSGAERAGILAEATKTWRFSPFGHCLPDALQRMVLVEQTLDVTFDIPEITLTT
jgi:ATP-dependent Lhr-like helicase